jgi:hypothetical protein
MAPTQRKPRPQSFVDSAPPLQPFAGSLRCHRRAKKQYDHGSTAIDGLSGSGWAMLASEVGSILGSHGRHQIAAPAAAGHSEGDGSRHGLRAPGPTSGVRLADGLTGAGQFRSVVSAITGADCPMRPRTRGDQCGALCMLPPPFFEVGGLEGGARSHIVRRLAERGNWTKGQ